jgi:hypothetical protein
VVHDIRASIPLDSDGSGSPCDCPAVDLYRLLAVVHPSSNGPRDRSSGERFDIEREFRRRERRGFAAAHDHQANALVHLSIDGCRISPVGAHTMILEKTFEYLLQKFLRCVLS